MNFGMRIPNIKKSIKARTTGRAKRMMKKAINPLYGKKGMGYIKNPEKAIKNSIYHKTTFGVNDIAHEISSSMSNDVQRHYKTQDTKKINKWIDFCLCLFLGYFGIHKFYEGKIGIGILYFFTAGLFGIGWIIDIFIILLRNLIY